MKTSLTILAILCVTTATVGQSTWHVQIGGNLVADGSAASPFAAVQLAVWAAANGDSIVVAPGVYYENVDFGGKSLHLVSSDGPSATIIDGSQSGSVIRIFGGSSTIEGLTIQGGIGSIGSVSSSFPSAARGGGILCQYASLSIRDCIITDNTVIGGINSSSGGGIFCDASSLDVVGTTISNNTCTHLGGGVLSSGGSVAVFVGCTITENRSVGVPSFIAYQGGGGVAAVGYTGIVSLIDCEISKNEVLASSSAYSVFNILGSNGGGGVYGTSSTSLFQCRILENWSDYGGGGVMGGSSIQHCTITGNGAIDEGGGVVLISPAATIASCQINGNYVTGPGARGGGVRTKGAGHVIANCTIVGNDAYDGGGIGRLLIHDSPLVINSILRGNTPNQLGVAASDANYTEVRSCNVEGGWTGAGEGNMDADPRFLEAGFGDFHLEPDSPCIDAGNMDMETLSLFDFEGQDRVVGDAVDIGADELFFDPAAAGTVGRDAGQLEDVFFLNASTGGALRTVALDLEELFQVAVLGPTANAMPASFAIYGCLGRPSPQMAFLLGLDVGFMCFAPRPFLPSESDVLFTFTDNFGIDTPRQLVPSQPAPWASPVYLAPDYPITVTLQGIIEEQPAVYRVTNAVTIRVR